MKIFSLGGVLTLSAVASVALGAPQLESRLRRDVSELVEPSAVEYLPPAITEAALLNVEPSEAELQAEPAALEADPEGTVLGDEGYEYRTVRRLKLRHRNRRDVSHLQPARQYLPPSKSYLPPAQEAPAAPAAPAAAPPADDTEEVVSAAEPKVNREYLPPTEAAPVVEETTEAVAPAPEEPADVRVVDVPTVSGQLLQDGYHYQQPAQVPAELREAAAEYLPPLGGEEVIVEGPAGGESAVLTSDGYQYRAIRRYRF
ncbi:fibrous sheath CABYR-binding protein [Drosophila subpulchrella]|uniref:fibrous sheath CABYR-binding protein n=1 Tax=Drosophila subpulchrella TaxID=1486046 RepID=UPI0018A16346|nr:fibrous sheath CABYR-binding protein [Drosophila subpulchrella]